MTCGEIIKQFLIENGFDGLCGYECGCALDDLMPCESPYGDCEAGYVYEVKNGEACKGCGKLGDCPIHINVIDYDFILHQDDMPLKCRIKKEASDERKTK